LAACDNQLLVVLLQRDKALDQVAQLAWREELIGQFQYVQAASAQELPAVSGVRTDSTLVVLRADPFGQKGTIVAQSSSRDRDELAGLLTTLAVKEARHLKSAHDHVRQGHSTGIFWETVVPVTDPEEARARERGRQRR
jgi:hypothetical protein